MAYQKWLCFDMTLATRKHSHIFPQHIAPETPLQHVCDFLCFLHVFSMISMFCIFCQTHSQIVFENISRNMFLIKIQMQVIPLSRNPRANKNNNNNKQKKNKQTVVFVLFHFVHVFSSFVHFIFIYFHLCSFVVHFCSFLFIFFMCCSFSFISFNFSSFLFICCYVFHFLAFPAFFCHWKNHCQSRPLACWPT